MHTLKDTRRNMDLQKTKLKEKFLEKTEETLRAVIPIVIIVMALCFTVAPIEPGILLAFILGAVFLVVGMVFFTFGAELSMTPMGENVGTCMTRTKKLRNSTAKNLKMTRC